MMSFLPTFKDFGNLEIVEVFDYYDEPIFVSCKNELDNQFLALLFDKDEENDIWLIVEVSTQRLYSIRSGGIDIHDAYKMAERGFIHQVIVPFDHSHKAIKETIDCSSLLTDDLPQKNEYLQLNTDTIPKDNTPIGVRAEQSNRILIDLRLIYPDIERTEAPAKALGKALQTFQDMSYAIGQAVKERSASARGKYPTSIVENNEWRVLEFQPGSFIVRLASSNYVNLLGEADLEETASVITDLMRIGSDADALKEKLEDLNIRVSSRYYEFLEAVSDKTNEVELSWASPRKKYEKVHVTNLTARTAMAIISMSEEESSKTIEMPCVLTGASMISQTFELRTKEGEIIKGKYRDQAAEYVNGSIIGHAYLATLSEKIISSVQKGTDISQYELLILTPIDEFEITKDW